MKHVVSTALLTISLASGAALAADEPDEDVKLGEELMEKLDADDDGVVTEEEYAAVNEEEFTEEWGGAGHPEIQSDFDDADRDGDGVLEQAEVDQVAGGPGGPGGAGAGGGAGGGSGGGA